MSAPSSISDSSFESDRLQSFLAGSGGSAAAYLEASRMLEHADPETLHLREIRLSLLSTYTIGPVLPYLAVEGARRGLAVRASVAPFGQIEQELLDPSSAVYRSEPDVIGLAVRLEEAAPAFVCDYLRMSSAEIELQMKQFLERLETLLRVVRTRCRAQLLVWNQVPPIKLAAGLADAMLDLSQAYAVAELNRRSTLLCRRIPGTYVFDVSRVAYEVGLAGWHDSAMFHLARVPIGPSAQIATAARLARYLRALTVPPCKCLVLDLDNTLWGGVLGEGVGAIDVGEDYPGSMYKEFQRQLRTYRDRGVLLAIASKNNERDVIEVFERHPGLILRWSDFAARQIHWGDKASSLAAIAAELRIGTDALAFFDDSPFERELVRRHLPDVRVIEVPSNALHFGTALEASGAFDHLVLTDEDRARAQLYHSEQQRRHLAASAVSIDEFLGTLCMKLTIGAVDSSTLPRVAQLVAKTNQFNLTTRRHTQADIEGLIAAGATALWMRVEDRFGDNGIVGVAIAVMQPPDAARLDTFLLSCRVMGRTVERCLLVSAARRVAARGAVRLFGEFIPTSKNAPVAGFLQESGFAAVTERPGWWQLDLSGDPPAMPRIFDVKELA